MGFGITPLKEMIQSVKLRWFGHVVRMGDEKCPKMAWKARTQGKISKRRPQRAWKKEIQKKILKERGIERKGVRAIRDCEGWKALCKPSTATGRKC
jgi:hypothetical protein